MLCPLVAGNSSMIMEIEYYVLISDLKRGNKDAFSQLFRLYYKDLVLFGGNFLPNKDRCEDIVQSFFLRLWENRESINIQTSLRSFMLQSVKNACLDELRHIQVMREHKAYTEWFSNNLDCDTENYVLYSELQSKLAVALDKIPSECREAFEMNRIQGIKYKDIAVKFSVSERTIEVRIGKALRLLRHYLQEFLVIILNVIFLLNK